MTRKAISSVVIILLITVVVVIIGAIFARSLTNSADEAVDIPEESSVGFSALTIQCNKICLDQYLPVKECNLYPTDVNGEEYDFTCAELAESSEFDSVTTSTGTSAKTPIVSGDFELSGDFLPCSSIRLTFSKDYTSISDFRIKITSSSGDSLTLRTENGEKYSVDDEGFTIVCGSGNGCSNTDSNSQKYTDIYLPCNVDNDMEAMKISTTNTKRAFTVTYKSTMEMASLSADKPKTDTLYWSCSQLGVSLVTFSPNQQYVDSYDDLETSVVTVKNPIGEGDYMIIHVVPQLDNTVCKDPTTEETIGSECLLRFGTDLGMSYHEGTISTGDGESEDTDNSDGTISASDSGTGISGSYYEFRMPVINRKDGLTGILFNMRMKKHDTENEEVFVCNYLVPKTITCKSQPSYYCYEGKDDEGKVHEYILSGPGSGIYTIDSICMYVSREAYDPGCVIVSTGDDNGEYVKVDKEECNLPSYIYRSGEIIDTREGASANACRSADLAITDIYPCKAGDCTKNTILTRSDKKGNVVIVIKNTGTEAVKFDLDNIHVVITNGSDSNIETAFDFISYEGGPDDGSLEPGQSVLVEASAKFIETGTYFEEGKKYTVTATIDNIDTAYYPINIANHETNNVLSDTITIHNQCCNSCDCPKDVCESCGGHCIDSNSDSGGYKCSIKEK